MRAILRSISRQLCLDSAPQRCIGFAPRITPPRFRAFFCVESGWGVYRQSISKNGMKLSIEILRGSLGLSRIRIGERGFGPLKADLENQRIACSWSERDGSIELREGVEIKAGDALAISLRKA